MRDDLKVEWSPAESTIVMDFKIDLLRIGEIFFPKSFALVLRHQ